MQTHIEEPPCPAHTPRDCTIFLIHKLFLKTASESRHKTKLLIFCLFCFCLFAFSRAALVALAYGGSQARGLIRAVAASLRQSHTKLLILNQATMSYCLTPMNHKVPEMWILMVSLANQSYTIMLRKGEYKS